MVVKLELFDDLVKRLVCVRPSDPFYQFLEREVRAPLFVGRDELRHRVVRRDEVFSREPVLSGNGLDIFRVPAFQDTALYRPVCIYSTSFLALVIEDTGIPLSLSLDLDDLSSKRRYVPSDIVKYGFAFPYRVKVGSLDNSFCQQISVLKVKRGASFETARAAPDTMRAGRFRILTVAGAIAGRLV